QIFGVSGDDVESHEKFKQKFSLNFPLIADTDHVLGEALGTWQSMTHQGQSFWANSRDTFLVDPEVKVRKVWRKVSPSETGAETLEECRQMSSSEQSRRTG